MRTTSALKTAALVIAAVVLALGTVQGGLALWNTTARAGTGAVQAADFAVTVKSGGATQQLSADGLPASIELPTVSGLMPGETRAVPFTVANSTDAGSGTFRIRVTASAPTVSGALAEQLEVGTGLAEAGGCTPPRSPTSVELAQGRSATFCLTLKLATAAPSTIGGQAGSASLTLTAVQLQAP